MGIVTTFTNECRTDLASEIAVDTSLPRSSITGMILRTSLLVTVCAASFLPAASLKAQSTETPDQTPPPIIFYKPDKSAKPDKSDLRDAIPFSMDVSPEYYIWEENSPAGTVRLTGPRVQLGLSYRQPKEYGWLGGGLIRGYYGNVQYNGFNQVPTGDGSIILIPTTARTEYVGGLAELQALYRSSLTERYAGSWMAAMGADIWDRSISGPGGYSELWTVGYVRGGYEIAPKAGSGVVGNLGIKMPFYVANNSDIPGFGHVTTEPKQRPSGYAEAGYQFCDSFALTAYFDSYWFGKSDVVSPGLLQPESKQYQIGLRLKWSLH